VHPDGSGEAVNRVADPPRRARVVDRVDEADRLTRQGVNVVLVVDPVAGAVVHPTGGPGRLAVMVGRLDDPAVRAAALEMAAELF
jgi:hypothetical protein